MDKVWVSAVDGQDFDMTCGWSLLTKAGYVAKDGEGEDYTMKPLLMVHYFSNKGRDGGGRVSKDATCCLC